MSALDSYERSSGFAWPLRLGERITAMRGAHQRRVLLTAEVVVDLQRVEDFQTDFDAFMSSWSMTVVPAELSDLRASTLTPKGVDKTAPNTFRGTEL